ncbi:MAG: TipAS antibiotic-recognition domain-containing protein [Tissierellia bacterium]|nr:TipAS antibiotic-recognition domain-containing protein [Tissierellia bacterium]MDD4726135.1 TipAS antibiotic-recognition domain-containing protein [Tissierellia bacterium]
MNDKEKFEGSKDKLVQDNEDKFGVEIREKYGKDIVEKSNERFKNMTQEDFIKLNELGSQIKFYLGQAMKHRDPTSDLAQKAAELHKEWITMSWGTYDKEAHANLAQMYVDDENFKKYYDDEVEGAAVLLRDAIFIYTGRK